MFQIKIFNKLSLLLIFIYSFSVFGIETNFGGVGISVSKENDYIVISYVNENSPAEKSGLLPDDIITHIDGRSLQGMNFDESIQLMRGEVGTKVVFTIIKNDNVSENITLERESIEVPKFIQGIQLVNQGSLEEGYEILLDLAKNGDPDAQYIIGQINSLDRYNIKNYEEGFYWTKIAADQNHPDANYYLAVLYSVGQGVKKNLHLGHQYFLKAAELNIPAFLDLAFNYYYGEGASKNINEAIKWFNKTINFPVKDLKLATQNKFSSYKYLYYIFMYEDGFIDKNKAFEFANILVEEKGDGVDYERLGYLYEIGDGVHKDTSIAAKYYKIAMEKGDLFAKQSLAKLYFWGDGVDQDYDKSFKLFNELINTKDFKLLDSYYISVGDFYKYGYGSVIKNYSLAMKFYKQSYNNGINKSAGRQIGEMYYEGLGVKKDIHKAIKWFNIALDSIYARDLTAEYLGKIYEYGEGNVPIDYIKAFNYYKIAADQNYSNGSFAVGRFFELGLHGIQDYEKAAYWYQKSAEQGYSTGALKLAELYKSEKLGEGLKDEAVFWFDYALNLEKKQGVEISAIAAKNLGLDHISGVGGKINIELGISYLVEAALNDPSTIFELASLSQKKIINKKQSKEIFSLIEEKSSSDNITKVSLALIYYLEALNVKKDIEKAEILLREVIESPYEDYDIHHAYAYVYLAMHIAESDYHKAESLLRFGITDILTKAIDKQTLTWSIDLLITSLSEIYIYNGDVHKVEIISKQLLEDSNTDSVSDLTKNIISCQLIDSFEAQHKYLEAVEYFNECYLFTEDIPDNGTVHLSYKLKESILLAKINQIEVAKTNYSKIQNDISHYYENEAVFDPTEIMSLDASLNYYLGDYKKSISLFEIIEKRINENKTLVFDNTLIFAVDYLKVLRKIGSNEKALQIAQSLIGNRLESGSLQTMMKKYYILHDFNEIYIDLLINNSKIQNKKYLEESFIAAQLSRNSELSQLIQQTIFKISLKDEKLKELIKTKQTLEYQMNNIFSKNDSASEGLNEDLILQKNKMWDDLNKKLIKINQTISKSHSDYYELLKPQLITTEQIQDKLDTNELLFSTFTGNEQSYAWFVFKDYLFVQEINYEKKDLKKIVANLREGLNQSDIVNASQLKPFDLNSSHHLYNLMFSNVKDRMKNINRIYLVLDGPLQSLPLETLVSEPTINDNYREASWLVNDYELLYLTGVNDFISFKKKEKEVITFAKSYIAFADPNLSDNEGVTRSSLKIDQLFDNRGVINIEEIKQLPSLPETAEEVKSIAGILDADFNDLYLQNDANEEKVKAIDLSKSKVISFATHGLVSGEIRGLTEPALVLTPPNEVSELNDGLLKSSEIALLDLNTDLVVLSACNTASSDGSPGAEGLSGLAKSFFIAGAKGILVSHWPVFSESTKDTMIKLFEEAKNDHTSYSSSLQKAKKSMIEENQFDLFAHPTFWAPFVMIGIN